MAPLPSSACCCVVVDRRALPLFGYDARMGPPLPHDVTRPPERDPETLKAIAARWGTPAIDELYELFPFGTRWTRFISRGRLAWVYADTPSTGGALFTRVGSTFECFPTPRFGGADPGAFEAILADAQPDVIADKDEIIATFAQVTGAAPILTQKDADALLERYYGADGADPAAVAQFEPPHFRGRTLAFVAAYHYEALLVRVLVDADSLSVRVETLGRSQRHMMPVG